MEMQDNFGLGWRPQLAAGILSNLDRIDVVEVIADDFFCASSHERRALRTLAAQVPVTLHGVSLGLASAAGVEPKLLDRVARLCDEVRPLSWSEHLAFVRGGGTEIGHLAAPPRTSATIDGTLANVETARSVVGMVPQLENVATLIEPPGSDFDEAEWISTIIQNSTSDLLLDLHNLYANASNFDFDPFDFVARIPAERIAAIHLAGGKWIGTSDTRRLLDDHLHDVPHPVYELLSEIGSRATRPLSVILERDGAFPDRSSPPTARTRERGPGAGSNACQCEGGMSAITFEAFLARIYVDEDARLRFLNDPYGEAIKAGLTAQEAEAAADIDRVGLQMFSQSLEHKRRKPRF